MHNHCTTQEISLEIKALVSEKTGLVLAICDEYQGLHVFGNTLEEVAKKLPAAIRTHFEMLGFGVESVNIIDSGSDSVFRAIPASICAQALLFEKGQRDSC